MKWIGQHIFDYISRFRNDIYVNAKVVDSTGSSGSSGDILTSTGTATEWSNAAVSYATVATYTHSQSSAASTWSITHSLGKFPSVTVIDSSNNVVLGKVTYTNNNALTVNFTAAFSGTAYLN